MENTQTTNGPSYAFGPDTSSSSEGRSFTGADFAYGVAIPSSISEADKMKYVAETYLGWLKQRDQALLDAHERLADFSAQQIAAEAARPNEHVVAAALGFMTAVVFSAGMWFAASQGESNTKTAKADAGTQVELEQQTSFVQANGCKPILTTLKGSELYGTHWLCRGSEVDFKTLPINVANVR